MQEKIGIAFAGGGAKSIAQLAMIKYIQDNDRKVDFVSGTSAGSLVATLFAMGLKYEEILDEIKEALKTIDEKNLMHVSPLSLIFNKSVQHGVIDATWLEELIEKILSKYNMHHLSDVKIPLAITAVDIYSGELIIFVSHPEHYTNTHPRSVVISDMTLAQAIRASMSFPLVFGSFQFNEYSLIDGGVRMNCPVPMLRDYGATKTLAITMRGKIDRTQAIDRSLAVANRVFELMSREAEYRHVDTADLVFNVPIGAVDIFDTQITDIILNQGFETLSLKKESLDEFFLRKTFLQKLLRR